MTQWLVRISAELRTVLVGWTEQRLHRRLSERLLKKVLAFPIRRYLDLKPGVVGQVLANGLIGYRLIVQHLTSSLAPVLVELVLIGAMLIAFRQPVFLGLLGLSLASYAAIFYLGTTKLSQSARRVSASQIDASSTLTESVQNLETIKYACAEKRFNRRFVSKLNVAYRQWCTFLLLKGIHGAFAGTVFGLSLFGSTYIAARKVQAGGMSIGDFVLVNSYMIQAFRPLEALGHALRDLTHGLAFIERLVDLFNHETEAELNTGNRLQRSRGPLRFDHVSFSYNATTPALKQISFCLQPGRTIAIVGPSGSGKSSLIRLLVRFFEPDGGKILFEGFPISKINLSVLRNAIAVVPQDTLLFDDTVAGNISVGKPGSSAEDILRAASVAGIHDLVATLPYGYQTVIGAEGVRLSGGERQRIAIARAVIKCPRLLVFDEATSSLDPGTERRILSNILESQRGSSMLVVTHRLTTIADVDEILVLVGGSIVDRGSHSELIRHSRVYKEMWASQQRPSRRS